MSDLKLLKKIVNRAADFGIPAHDIVVDPLSNANRGHGNCGIAGIRTLVRRLREELGVNTQHAVLQIFHLGCQIDTA